jgi:hypothetical protein
MYRSKLPRNAIDPETLGSTAGRAAAFKRNGQQGATRGVIGSIASLNSSLDNCLLSGQFLA